MNWKRCAVAVVAVVLAATALASERTVTLATLEWQPYVGSAMPSHGFAAEVVVEAFKRAGYDVQLEFHPWAQSLELARSGKTDGVFPAYRDESREAFLSFSDPIGHSPIGLYKKKTYILMPGVAAHKTGYNIEYSVDPRIDEKAALQGLKGYKFGVVKGYANTPEFDAAAFLTKIESASDEENLKKLFRDEVQLVVIDRFVAQNIVAQRYPWRVGEFEFMEPPLALRALYVGFSKQGEGAEQKRKDFNAALKVLQQDGVLDRIASKYGF